jgi:hypothetical protein
MAQLTLLIYLYDDPPNDLVSRARYVEGRDHLSLLEHDGVTQLSNNVLLFDQTKSHDVFVQLCREIVLLKRPYLIVALEAESALVVGPLSKEVQASLSRYGVPLCTTLIKTP